MSYIVIDVESDGPIPGDYSMVCFGAVIVRKDLTKTFYGQTKPISYKFIPEALNVSGFTRAEHETFDDPKTVMEKFAKWIKENTKDKPIFISDNNGFDWQWINWYFYKFLGKNPFGYSSRRIGDLYCGMMMDSGKNGDWKRKYRKTRHTHNPVDDAMGNAEALLAFKEMGLKINLK